MDVALSRLPKQSATFALGIDQPLYLSVHSAAARLAPEGCALIQTAKYLPPDNQDNDRARVRGVAGFGAARMARCDGAPAILARYDSDECDAASRNDGTRGRPGPEVADVPGLYVVGDWVGDEGLLVDASLASARKAADLILLCSR